MAVQVLFFARIREQLGRSAWQATVDGQTIAALVDGWVVEQGEDWSVLQQPDVRCALNQVIVSRNSIVHDGDELAFFPPVTGG